MRPTASIKTWLTVSKMFQWLQDASDQESYKRRLAIWLTHTGKLHAYKVADSLGVSVQSVWLWIGQYNTYGPDGLERVGRGGRRWGFMSFEQEVKLLVPFVRKVRLGHSVKADAIKVEAERLLGRTVSRSYIYRMLSRHNWGPAVAQSRSKQRALLGDDFEKISQPWRRGG